MNPKPIEGEYEFGEQAPAELMGWIPEPPGDLLETEVQITAPARPSQSGKKKVLEPIWEVVKRRNHGRHLPTLKQETGDCVAAGLCHAGQYLAVDQISSCYEEEIYHPWHISYIYGISRVQIGGGRIPGPGSRGIWGAAAVQRYGVLFADDPGAPPYSGSISTKWGERPGPPSRFQQLAFDNKVLTTRRLNNVGEIREALQARQMVTIASMRGFRMAPYEFRGKHVWKPEGIWPHQMCLIALMNESFEAAYRLNSWGPNAHGTPLNGEPPGGAWNLLTDLAAEIASMPHEIFAYDIFEGDADKPNHELIWIPKNLRNVA